MDIKVIKIMIVSLMTIFDFLPLNAQDWALYGVDADEFHYGISRIKNPDWGNDDYGYIDSSGKLIIPYSYKNASDFFGLTAIVQTKEDAYGIINRKGDFVFGPVPSNYRIREVALFPDVYEIYDQEKKKYGLFDGNRIIVNIEWDHSYISFPFFNYYNGKDYSGQIFYNFVTQESFTGGSVDEKGYFIIYKNNDTNVLRVYDKKGEPINLVSLQTSSKGVEVFKDKEIDNYYGLRNKETGDVLIEPVFFSSEPPFWINDMIWLYDGKENIFNLINGNGQIVTKGDFSCQMMPGLIQIWPLENNNNNFTYYDYTGKEIIKLKNRVVQTVNNSDFVFRVQDNDNYQLFDLKTQTFIDDVKYANREIDGMVGYTKNSSSKSYFYNPVSGKILGPYDYANDFNEGGAIVKINQKEILIDKNGKEFRMPSNYSILGNRISEGVFKVIDEKSRVRGFFYNPFGHGNYVYDQKEGQLNDIAYSNVLEEAYTLFKNKKYAQAMNKFYQLMMLQPEDSSNFNNYATCLYNLGKYDEALTAIDVALEYWSDNSYAINLRKTILDVLNEQERKKKYEESLSASSSNSIWDAIGNFANVIYSLNGTYNTDTAYVPSYLEKENISSSGDSYQIQYRNWERRAESNYNSITNLGHSYTNKKGEKSGSAGKSMSGGNYISVKRSFREAQRQMRDIRRKASKEGIKIPQSHWETATISY